MDKLKKLKQCVFALESAHCDICDYIRENRKPDVKLPLAMITAEFQINSIYEIIKQLEKVRDEVEI
tara:strand:- start:806 stop:1003 length:198 start_codon:yes stop_codon:yes gene_type:complete